MTSIDFNRLKELIAARRPDAALSLDADGLANLVQQYREVERQRDEATAKLAAIGRLCPTHFDDREQLLGELFKILRGQLPAEEEFES
ncbi:hypothetical protein [Halomonas rhizosphaerae]|uniref:DUF4404 family protein n=1 Tax=Halomonas rhizosphaerae TaxID=3043296 RepID=A0ABT6UXE7_9GAMM|nr:hypothetical protein [Halomonas rhizosphaerae]MDI5890648.1 hypothetical protein [Halomonas rhizosphaerae]